MASKPVLYRKFRSRSFDEVVGQDHIVTILRSALKAGRLAHAYLFVGPRGVGKTSVARILAFEANALPYSDTGHIDIIEIDAASNRRIDEIRELRDKIHIAPVQAKYRVYIIDEVHMLTREAFNALLKTLEEPPAHTIFILATTEAHKVPETITSRTQKFVFRPITLTDIKQQLQLISGHEKIKIDEPALDLISAYGDGSFRDSISLLDQLASYDKPIDQELTESFLGFAPTETVTNLLDSAGKGDLTKTSTYFGQLLASGVQPQALAIQLINSLRKTATLDKPALDLIDGLLTVQSSPMPHITLETKLLRYALNYQVEQVDQGDQGDQVGKGTKTVKTQPTTSDLQPTSSATQPTTSNLQPTSHEELTPINTDEWQKILNAIKEDNYPLYGVLRMSEVWVSDDKMVFNFAYKFHASRLEDKITQAKIREIAADIRPKPPAIEVVVDANTQPTVGDLDNLASVDADTAPGNSKHVEAVLDAFGGGEVLEL